MRICVEARDLEAGDLITQQGEVISVRTEGDTTTVAMKPYGALISLWAEDHVWVDRAVVGA